MKQRIYNNRLHASSFNITDAEFSTKRFQLIHHITNLQHKNTSSTLDVSRSQVDHIRQTDGQTELMSKR